MQEFEQDIESVNQIGDRQMMAEEEFALTSVRIDVGCNNLAGVNEYIQKYEITAEKRDILLQTLKCHAWDKKNIDYSAIKNFLNNLNV